MKKIENLLNQNNLIKKTENRFFIKNKVISCLEDIIEIRFKKEDINIKNFNIYINCKPTTKNFILLKKTSILEKISKETGLKIKNIF